MIATCHICGLTKECTRTMIHNGVRKHRCAKCDYACLVNVATAQALNQADAKRTAKSRKTGSSRSGSTIRFKRAMERAQ